MADRLPPNLVFGDVFYTLLKSGIWKDDKVVADLIPITEPEVIIKEFNTLRSQENFDLQEFVQKHFIYQIENDLSFQSDLSKSIDQHIEDLWKVLERDADIHIKGSSLIPLPYPYIVPGGRFNEIYYWDSYFTMLGLNTSGKFSLIENMVNNFAWLIENLGFIPNGNRTYFLGRSQPPFFSLMVTLLADIKGKKILGTYLNHLVKEYKFWMEGQHLLLGGQAHKRVVNHHGHTLNRYWDDHAGPRPEMWATDSKHAESLSDQESKEFFTNVRAACESGWDFSTRWFKDLDNILTIRTTDILPIDLNCLLWHLEYTITQACHSIGDLDMARVFSAKANKRKAAILEVFWSERDGVFKDVEQSTGLQTDSMTLAAMYPLFFSLANADQAQKMMKIIKNEFLVDGGVQTSLINSGQQWDAPNGWAPLQWITIKGLRNYSFNALADIIKNNWLAINEKIYHKTGKMLEKYNVVDSDLETGGGEYPVQDGFGWTNGVFLSLSRE